MENLYPLDLFGQPIAPKSRGPVADKFLAPPFSVLNAREGWWRERKDYWLGLGIEGEIGRASGIVPNSTLRPESQDGCFLRPGKNKEGEKTGASVFDPVLCELVYRWFSPPGGTVIDPFAGGSVRGIVAAKLGRKYYGVDLLETQVEANRLQAAKIAPGAEPEWWVGDARAAHYPDADLLFTCPPYGNLERYSDDPRDLSTLDPKAFRFALRFCLVRAAEKLRPDSFVVLVLGEYRDKKTGLYVGLVPETICELIDAGLGYYNEAILVTPVGTLMLRAPKQFVAGRKLGKTHQNLLVFVKGDWKKAAKRCGEEF